jgi:DNA repair protein RadD
MSFENRHYQDEIVEAVFDYLFNKTGNPVVAAPGGVGKSHSMNRIIRQAVEEYPGTRVMSLVHDGKVINQNCNAMLKFWPEAPVGVYSSGLKCRDTQDTIIYAGIQSVAKRAAEFGRINLVIIDECDMVSPKQETMYQRFISDLQLVNPELRVIGFTATPYRLGTGCLTNLDLWDEVCIDLTKTDRFNWFIDNGFLSPLISKRTAKEIDITDIVMRGGEFEEKSMQAAADTDELNEAVVEECIRYGHDRKHWLIFSSGVEHGQKLAKLFNSRGVPSIMLSGKDPIAYREKHEELFRKGKYRALINCGLYGRGWDFPALDMLAWARATQSVALWVQGCVRLTRRAKGKKNGLVLDFAGNTRRLGPVNNPIIPHARRKGDAEKGEAPVKDCPECHSYVPIQVRRCPDCGYEFPPPKTIKKTADVADILERSKAATRTQIEEFHVVGVRYEAKESKKGNRYLRVSYMIGVGTFHEYVFFESDNQFLQRKVKAWWAHRKGGSPLPETCDEAAERANDELLVPSIIRVDVAQKHPEVVGCDIEDTDKPSSQRSDTVHRENYDDDDIPF